MTGKDWIQNGDWTKLGAWTKRRMRVTLHDLVQVKVVLLEDVKVVLGRCIRVFKLEYRYGPSLGFPRECIADTLEKYLL